MEMPPGQEQPGSVSFFIAHAQRRNPEAQVTAISLTRGYNPVDKSTTLTFGEPMTLDVDAPRTQQRELDRALVRQIGLGVEVNAAQATSAILYERCVRGQLEPAPIDDLQTAVFGVLSALGPDRCEPEALENPARATARTLRWLAKKDMLELRKGRVRPNREAILSQPPLDRTYKRLNPVKYLTNQILHLDEAVCEIRRQALEGLNASR
jgi:hypothetical protein